jgi:hypothetical protein
LPADGTKLVGRLVKKISAVDWFTEGFATPDLKAAKALLDELEWPSCAQRTPRQRFRAPSAHPG